MFGRVDDINTASIFSESLIISDKELTAEWSAAMTRFIEQHPSWSNLIHAAAHNKWLHLIPQDSANIAPERTVSNESGVLVLYGYNASFLDDKSSSNFFPVQCALADYPVSSDVIVTYPDGLSTVFTMADFYSLINDWGVELNDAGNSLVKVYRSVRRSGEHTAIAPETNHAEKADILFKALLKRAIESGFLGRIELSESHKGILQHFLSRACKLFSEIPAKERTIDTIVSLLDAILPEIRTELQDKYVFITRNSRDDVGVLELINFANSHRLRFDIETSTGNCILWAGMMDGRPTISVTDTSAGSGTSDF